MDAPRKPRKRRSLFDAYQRLGFNAASRESFLFMLGTVGIVLVIASLLSFFWFQDDARSAALATRGAVQSPSPITVAFVFPSDGFSFSSGQSFSIEVIANSKNPIWRMQIFISGVAWLTCAQTTTCRKVIRADNPLWRKGANRISVTAIDQDDYSSRAQVTVYKK